MLEEIRELIRNAQFEDAKSKLEPLLASDDPKTAADAAYLMGYIHTHWRYSARNENWGRNYLLSNIRSDYPVPQAFSLYAKNVEDKNKAEGYLRKGLARFPGNPLILKTLLDTVPDKHEVIDMVDTCGATDFSLLSSVIEYLIQNKEWDRAEKTICLLRNNHDSTEHGSAYLGLLLGYSKLFCQSPDYLGAIDLFKSAIRLDLDNVLGYSHYLGLIYAGIKLGDWVGARIYFDRIPVNDSIFDLWEGLRYFIPVEFDVEYKEIFDAIINACGDDAQRKCKAKCLYSLYLFNPYPAYGIRRFGATDYQNVKAYCGGEYSKAAIAALFAMACDAHDYREANLAYLQAIEKGDDLGKQDVYYSTITDEAELDTILKIVSDIEQFLEDTEYMSADIFLKNIFCELARRLHENGCYDKVATIADYFAVSSLGKLECAFECAYAYAEQGSGRAFELYSIIVENEPDNASALNNLGLIYEKQNELDKAFGCFKRAVELSPSEIRKRNYDRIKQQIERQKKADKAEKQKAIRALVKDVNLNYLQSIGYDDAFIAMFDKVGDVAIRNIVVRDIRECVIAIAAQQDKTATILIGSILEAILFVSLTQAGVTSYTFTGGKQPKTTTVEKMVLHELLTVARELDMITENGFRLSHYIRDYRNVVHPAKELRESKDMSHENVLFMWHVFKQLAKELLK